MNVTKKQRDSFELYRRFSREDCGINVSAEAHGFLYYEDGVTAMESFSWLDSTGDFLPCAQPKLLAIIVQGKARLNLHIKMWAEGVAEWTAFVWELRRDFTWLPDWVWKAVEHQARKIRYGERRWQQP